MSNLCQTQYTESIENFSFGSNVVNDELYTKVIRYIASNKPIELFNKSEEELSEEELNTKRRYEEIDILNELLDRHYNGLEEYEDYEDLCLFARNITPFKLMEFAMTNNQFNEAKDRILSYFCYGDDELYSYDDLDILIEQEDENYLVYLYAKSKIESILETTTKKALNNSVGRRKVKINNN